MLFVKKDIIMKRYFFCISFLFFAQVHSLIDYNPLLVVILMVKNEEAAMGPTLQPFLDAGIDSYVILDTGSSDNTIQTTQNLFDQYGIKKGHIIEQPFVNFATSRNYAIKCAEEKFPNAGFFLMIDAEWIMHNTQELIQFCSAHTDDPTKTYLIRMDTQNLSFAIHRLFKPNNNIFFWGAVHEVLNVPPTKKLPDTVYFNLAITHYGHEKTKQRWLRDCKLLHAELEKNPHNTHALFYLGQTYGGLNDCDNAIKYFKSFAATEGETEFNFMTHCRIAELYEQKGDWDKALHYYLEAYNMRPTRAEPLVSLASHYLQQQQFNASFLFARQAMNLPYPKDDIFLIDKSVYEYTRYDILTKVAYCVGEYAIGEQALYHALKAKPNDPLLGHIAHLYQSVNK